MKWSSSRVLCDHKISIKIQGKFYKTAIKKQHFDKTSTAKMRMLRSINENTSKDRI